MANLRQEIQSAYRKTPMFKLDTLLAEETKWSRKQTIAQNKLDHVRMRINKYAKEMIAAKHQTDIDMSYKKEV